MTQRKLVGLRIGEVIDDWYKEEAKRMGISKSELMRLALIEYMNSNGQVNANWKKLEFLINKINEMG